MKKVVLITGGTRGIGLGIAKSLADEGCDLALNGVRPESEVGEILDELRARGAEVHYIQADQSRPLDRNKLFQYTRAHFGRLNILVNNAGVAPLERRNILEMTEESYDRVMNINLKGAWFVAQQAANWMIDQKQLDPSFEGCIINVGSISATAVSVGRGEYCISKAGLAMTTQLLAVELGPRGIPVYEIRPGLTLSDMTVSVKEQYDDVIADGVVPQQRWGTPEDNGKAAAALVRGDFPFSTGQVFLTDGGFTLRRL